MLENLKRGGFYFWKNIDENRDIYENRFTGLLLIVDFFAGKYEVIK